jgi:streptogramin lyase
MRPAGKRRLAQFFLGFLVVVAVLAAQDKSPAPPPLRLAATALKAEATFEAAGERHLLATADAVWIASQTTGTVIRIDPKANKPVQTITLAGSPCGSMAFAFGSLWVPLCGKGLARIDPKTNAVTAIVGAPTPSARGAVASGTGSIWAIADDRGTVLRIDPDSNTAVAELYTERGAAALAFGADALWVLSPAANLLTRVNAHTNVITHTIKVPGQPSALLVAEGAVWTLNAAASTIARLDVKTNKVAETIPLGAGSGGGQLASGAGSIWATRAGLPLARIDPRTNRLVQLFSGVGGGGIAFGHNALWLAATPTQVWRVDPKLAEAVR